MAEGPKLRLGEMLVDEGIITPEQLQQAIAYQKEKGVKLGTALVDLGFVAKDVVMAFVGTQLGIPHVDLTQLGEIPGDVLKSINQQTCVQHQLIPIQKNGARLTVAMADPLNMLAIDDIKLTTGCDVDPVIASEGDIRSAIEKNYGVEVADEESGGTTEMAEFMESIGDESSADGMEVEEDSDEEADIAVLTAEGEEGPVVRLVNLLITEAVRAGASDIHIEPFEAQLRVRYRVDGVLMEVQSPPRNLGSPIVSRIKIMANLDIAERRKPQDGKIRIKNVLGKTVDFRVSTIPVANGEKVCMRILDSSSLSMSMEKLGFLQPQLQIFEKTIQEPYGMILVVGPTGSGKSTTLYSALNELNDVDTNISTVEDPVEYKVHGINQVQVINGVVSFADALRAFLRQDPDIILVGELRDKETAHTAIEAALTGHLVFGTLHTNDAPQSVTRLTQMGIEPFMLASTLIMTVGQRLLRRVCNNCKEAYTATDQEWELMSIVPEEFRREDDENRILYRGAGCSACNNKGMKGRMAIHEIFTMNDEVKQLVVAGESSQVLKQAARSHGMITLRESAAIKVLNGDTTTAELVSEAKED